MRFISLAVLAASLATPALAQDGEPVSEADAVIVSGGVALVSQYRFRGIGLSDENPAVQGWMNLNHDNGVYVGAWASTIDGFGELGGSNLELDLYGGYKTEVADGVTVDAGLLYYAYPGSTGGDFEFFEPYAKLGLTVGSASVTLGLAYAPVQDGIGGNDNVYASADAALPIAGTPLALDAHIGRSEGDTTLTPGGGYTDWSIGASATWDALTARMAYVDTDISDFDSIAAGAAPGIVDNALVLSLTAAF